MTKEELLTIFVEAPPTMRSRYTITGNRPMWTVKTGHISILARPSRTMTRTITGQWAEVDGIAYGFTKNGAWIGQECSDTIDNFLANIDTLTPTP